MAAAVKAGVAYFALVFAIGVVLGAVQVLAVIPKFGEVVAVLLEAPVMFVVSWLICGDLLRRFAVPADVAKRVAMGGAALALLMLAEFGLGALAFGKSAAEFLSYFRTWAGAIGLVAQLAFAAGASEI